MPTDYIPSTDAGVLFFARNFVDTIAGDPESFGLSPAVAAQLALRQSAYSAAYPLAVDPGTRGLATVRRKDAVRDDLVAYLRLCSRAVQGAIGVSDVQRQALNLTLRDARPTVIRPPDTAPTIDIVSAVGRTVRLRLHDPLSPHRVAKPTGCAGASIFSFVGPTPPAGLSDWRFERNVTRTTAEVEFPTHVPAGATVWLAARWYNPRAQAGPIGHPECAHLPGGNVARAA